MTLSDQFNQVLRTWSETFMRRSMQDFVQFSKDSGLSMSQLHALFRLHHEGICGVTGIGEHLGVTSAAASQMVDRLVLQGLVERGEAPQDRRVKRLTLTLKGRQLVLESIEARRRWMEQLTDALEPHEQILIIDALTVLNRAASDLKPADPAALHSEAIQPGAAADELAGPALSR